MAHHFIRKQAAGSIFYRVTGLMRSGQMNWKDRPLWYDVYASFPPKYEPNAVAPFEKQNMPLRKLYYKEDIARARFFKEFSVQSSVNVADEQSEYIGQMFIDLYCDIASMWPELDDEQLYRKAVIALHDKIKTDSETSAQN